MDIFIKMSTLQANYNSTTYLIFSSDFLATKTCQIHIPSVQQFDDFFFQDEKKNQTWWLSSREVLPYSVVPWLMGPDTGWSRELSYTFQMTRTFFIKNRGVPSKS